MSDPKDCWNELKELVKKGSGDLREAAGKITAAYREKATDAEFQRLQGRLENTLHAYTTVPLSRHDQQDRWLAVLEGACAITTQTSNPLTRA
jgi:hypothetical protein